VKKYITNNFKVEKRVVKERAALAKRRRQLLVLANKRSKKGSRTWPTYSSASQVKAALNERGTILSVRQVQRELHKIGLKAYVRQPVPTRCAADKVKRRAFGKSMRSWPKAKRKRIVFTDESWLSCCERTGRVMWAKNIRDVLPLERKARWNVPSCMVWAAVGHGFKSELIILPAKKKDEDGQPRSFRLDADQYVRRCLQPVMPELLKKKRILQQDGARSHIAKRTMQYLRNKKLEVIADWPAYSPDLNCIERLWKELNQRVGRRCPMTMDELQQYAQEEWAAIPQKLINKHIAHFENQIARL
jgi:hypothetical protein